MSTRLKRSFYIRGLLCLAPLAVGFLLPPALALWVESDRFQLPLTDAVQAVSADYSRPLGDSLWVTTFYQYPPFAVLAAVLAFFARQLTTARLAVLCVFGLLLIFLVQIPATIRVLEDIPKGEAEFVQWRYAAHAVLSLLLLGFLLFLFPFRKSVSPNIPNR